MFKKLLTLGAMMAFALAGAVSAQAAGINGTAHEQNKTGGPCAACHLPHGAKGKRLWVAAGVPNTRIVGDVAMLCGYCHINLGGATGLAGLDPISDSFVFGNASHGYLMSRTTAAQQPRTLVWSELPYHRAAGGGNIGRIECTTCHDVHNNDVGKQPFLRLSPSLLCAACHGKRQWTGAAWQSGDLSAATFGNWGRGTNYGLANPGSHPVGLDVTGDGGGAGRAPITIWRSMKVAFTSTRASWVTGGHLSGGQTGGVTCATCHAVHGLRPDADGNVVNEFDADRTQPVTNMLAIYQGLWSDAAGRSVANGNAGKSGLCEACHLGDNSQMLTAYTVTATWNTFTVAAGPTNPNPGASPYSHPVDGMRVVAYPSIDWVPGATWPTAGLNWPIGNSTATSASVPNVVCESCHVPHAAANWGRNDFTVYSQAGTTDYMLRTTADVLCGYCHQVSPNRHHPINKRYNTAGVTYLVSIPDTARMDTLGCSDCHSGSGAHNWSGDGGVGMDRNWKPTDNGRNAVVANEVFNTLASITCMDCHSGMLGVPQGNNSPTLHAALYTRYSGPNFQATPEAYNTIGYASHVLGRIGGGGTGTPVRATYPVASYWASFNARITNHFTATGPTWTAATFGGNGGWSRFGGVAASPVLVCESCHELEPTKNATTHLLLGYYVEEQDATARPAIASSRSYFCEGCHFGPGTSGTHQMSSQTITRTNALLSTNTAASWLITPTDTVNVKLSNNDRMNCDTCHQAHDAATNSYTFILDVNNAAVSLTNSNAAVGAGVYGSYTAGYWCTVQQLKGGNHNRFCQQCHNY